MKNAIHGLNNVRFDDLEHMVEFTHTGDLGKEIFVVGKCILIFNSFQRTTTPWGISIAVRDINTGI